MPAGRDCGRLRAARSTTIEAVAPYNLILVFVARLDPGDEDFPEALSAHPHGVTPAVPQIEIANDAHAFGRWCEYRKRNAANAVDHHRVGAELLVKMHVGALAEQIEVELGEDRGETIGVFQLQLTFAVTHPDAIAARAICKPSFEQPRIVNAPQVAGVPLVVDDGDVLGVGEEHTHQRYLAFDMGAKIAKRIGMATLDDGIGLRRKRGHDGMRSDRERMRQVPASGTRSQSGRCASSYSTS